MCKTPAIADIVILVDGSWSIGRINFRLVRTFLENLVKAFSVEIDKTRIGEKISVPLEDEVWARLESVIKLLLNITT